MEGAELFDLSKDIGEKTNLADQEPAKVKELAADWDRWNSDNIEAKWLPRNRAPGAARRTRREGEGV